jgi:hypothetical protein
MKDTMEQSIVRCVIKRDRGQEDVVEEKKKAINQEEVEEVKVETTQRDIDRGCRGGARGQH